MPVNFYPYNPISALDKIILKGDGSPLHGEICIYKKLVSDLGKSKDEWHVWHDLKLPVHSDNFNYYKKTSAQIDFLILCKEGILVLEVKGGPISVKDNCFFYGRNFERIMKQNPFKQAEGYKFTLKDNILNNIKGCFFCDAVALPHVNYEFKSKLINKNTLWTDYKSDEYNNSLENFIKSVFKHTKEKHKKHFRSYPTLGSKEIFSIKNILSPIISDKNIFDSLDTLEWLGLQNIEILDGLNKNSRIMIEGPPGSGKTTIAKAFIDRQIGKKGIYICWNNFLMHYTKKILQKRNNTKDIEVTTFFKFLQMNNPEQSYDEIAILDENSFYNLLQETLNRIYNDKSHYYDFIVVDEGQDVFDRGLDLFINKLCGYNGKGLINGNSLVLYDIDQSYSLNNRPVSEIADLLTEYFTHFKLNEIKRSAQNPDIRRLSYLTLDNPKCLSGDDFNSSFSNIVVNKHSSLTQVKKHIVYNILNSIRDKKSSLRGHDCILLIESTFLKGEYRGNPDMHYELAIKDVFELNERNITDTANLLKYTSILKYKGLECKNVFLVVSEPSNFNKYELFIGVTRAINNIQINIVIQ
jgi:hypothetical protein